MPDAKAWARLFAAARPLVKPMPRAGAWYPVVEQGEGQVVIEVGERRVAVPANLVELRDKRPTRFTVVQKTPGQANPLKGSDEDLGKTYAVCPECDGRTALHGEPVTMVCEHCGHRGEVAWWE